MSAVIPLPEVAVILNQLKRKRRHLEQQILEDYRLGYPTNELLDYHLELTQQIRTMQQQRQYPKTPEQLNQ